jgi:hypothetical protein
MGGTGLAWWLIGQLAAADTVPIVQAPPPVARPSVSVQPTASPPAVPRTQQPVRFDATRFDSLTASELRLLFDEAFDRGLPVRLLVNRALEGAARKAGGARILRVVREYSDALAAAKFALGEGSTDTEVDAAASAIRAGIDPRTVAALRTTRPPGTAVTALVVLTDLVQRGVPASAAREAVTTIARQPRSDDALIGLQQTVAKNAQRGPGMALAALNTYVQGAVSGAQPPTPDRKPVRPPDS